MRFTRMSKGDLQRAKRGAQHGSGCERGSGTVATFAGVILVLCLGVMVISGIHIYAVKAQVNAVADVSALAGATHSSIQLWTRPTPQACALATEVAHHNQTTMSSCHTRDGDIYVQIEKPATFFGVPVKVRARARAGPAHTWSAEASHSP